MRVLLLLAIAGPSFLTWGAGSGLNVVVVVNQNSTNSVQLGNDYCEKRGVPPQNLFRMTNWTGGSLTWNRADFENDLRDPLLAMLATAGLTNQVEYVLLSMDIPYRVQNGGDCTSTTSALFYGFKTNTVPPPGAPDTCSLPDYSSNSFAFSELPFAVAKPDTADTNGFLAFMLTDDSLAEAEAILNRGLAGDASFPTQTVYLQKTGDSARNVRFFSFDNAVFDSRIRGDSSVVRIDSNATTFTNTLGFLTGFATLSLPANAFVPGAFGDSLTSYAGALFDNFPQTTLLAFLNAGAVASYGTVVEPCNYLQKFPDPSAYFYQNRGFCMAEAYYQSLLNPYQGVLVGEPLCAPFAFAGHGDWSGLTNSTLLSGVTSLPTATFSAAAANLPVGQVDLFIDGNFARTLTNLPPRAGDSLSVTLNGSTVQYTVPANSSFASVTAGLAGALNNQSNVTKVVATPIGDRLELQSLDLSTPGSNVLLSASVTAGASVATTILNPARPGFLDSIAVGYLGLLVSNSTVQGDWLQLQVTKTNGIQVSLSVTNNNNDTNVVDLCQSLMGAINADPDLQGTDGVLANDIYPDVNLAQFLVYARAPGWGAAQVKATLTGSPGLFILPGTNKTFEDNLSDLRPRNHLYIGAGMGVLPVSLLLDTSQLADGFHELALVAYEGTSVRTQTRVSRTVQVRNSGRLSATLVPQLLGTNVTLDALFNISVQANTNGIASIELFSSGGSIGVVSNQTSATFSVPSAWLGVGLHPFYSVVTDLLGNRFRTLTVSIRIVPSFAITIAGEPLTLSWQSVPGLTYAILSAPSPTGPFQQVGSLTASGPTAQWVIPGSSRNQAYYRVMLSP